MTISSGRRTVVRQILPVAAIVGVLSGVPAWMHDEPSAWEGAPNQAMIHSAANSSTVAQPHMQTVNSNFERQEHGSHQHEINPLDACPQLEELAEVDVLKECVTALTHQISDLLKLIMNLSDALAESRNALMLATDERNKQSQVSTKENQS
jgi:hypothetical protein